MALRKRAATLRQQSNSSVGGLKVLAAQTLKIASINGLGELDKLENDLEEEIRYDNRSPAKTAIGKVRRAGEHHLHSKIVLLLVVILNIIDCILVMVVLTLEFHHFSHKEHVQTIMIESFERIVDAHTEVSLAALKPYQLLTKILKSQIVWDHCYERNNTLLLDMNCEQCTNDSAKTFSHCPSDFRNKSTKLDSDGEVDEIFLILGHKLHYISVGILSVLVIILFMRIFCSGKRFFKSRMQVFDGIIVIISFILDVVFIEGLHVFDHQTFVILLSCLLPWRILRVVNSLIVAVLDKQRLNLKIIYTQKKKISRALNEANSKGESMQRQIEMLKSLCSSRGVGDYEMARLMDVAEHKPAVTKTKSHGNKNNSSGGLASLGTMALGKLAFQTADSMTQFSCDNKDKRNEQTAKQNGKVSNGELSKPNDTNINGSIHPISNGIISHGSLSDQTDSNPEVQIENLDVEKSESVISKSEDGLTPSTCTSMAQSIELVDESKEDESIQNGANIQRETSVNSIASVNSVDFEVRSQNEDAELEKENEKLEEISSNSVGKHVT